MSEAMMRRVTTVASGFVLLALTTTGCDGSEPSAPADSVEQVQGAITGGWTALTPINGWQAAGGSYQAPAVGKVNGIVTFRGAIKAANPTDTVAFTLPSAFQPIDSHGFVGATAVKVKIVLSGGKGGTLTYDYLAGAVRISQDGMGSSVGPEAKALTSLDGASYDAAVATPLDSPGWIGTYGFRVTNDPQAVFAKKTTDGFIRFQGFIKPNDPNPSNYMFTIPSDMRPGNTVWVYADIGFSSDGWSQVAIYPTGEVWVDGNDYYTWTTGVSLEGVSFSKTLTGNQALPMVNSWTSYSARAARVGTYGGVVRFQGAISGGTSTTIGTLPVGMRPPKTVQLPTVVYGPTTGTLTITSGGVMTITNPGGLTNATLFTSLDGVSFGI